MVEISDEICCSPIVLLSRDWELRGAYCKQADWTKVGVLGFIKALVVVMSQRRKLVAAQVC